MPRYFFDIDDGAWQSRDSVGCDLSGPEEARREAIVVLPRLALDLLPDGDRRHLTSIVRDETGRGIFRATLLLVAEWLG